MLVFAIFLIPLSLFGYWFYVTNPDLPLTLPSLPLAFAPALASILARLLGHEGFADVSFRLRGPRIGSAFLLAIGFPWVVGTLAYGLAYLFGLAPFDPPPFPVGVASPLGQFAVILAFAATVGILLVLPTTGAEEIGWRGYLLPRMIQARLPQPIALSSLIWGAWHLPVLFAGVYAVGPSRLVSAAALIVGTLAFGSLLAWMRIGTGSIWPCILAHAGWNALINAGFTFATRNATENIWLGESGILVAIVVVLMVLLIRRAWKPSPLANEGGDRN